MQHYYRIGEQYYRVIGVMEPAGKSAKAEGDSAGKDAAAHRMFIPLDTARIRYGDHFL